MARNETILMSYKLKMCSYGMVFNWEFFYRFYAKLSAQHTTDTSVINLQEATNICVSVLYVCAISGM